MQADARSPPDQDFPSLWPVCALTIASPVVIMIVSMVLLPTTIDPLDFLCVPIIDASPPNMTGCTPHSSQRQTVSDFLRAQRFPDSPALSLDIASASSSSECPEHQTRAWTGTCELGFGVDATLISSTDACVSLYLSSCGAYTPSQRELYGVPRGFTMNKAYNDAMLARVRRVESLRLWSQGPWARLAGACTHNQVSSSDSAGVQWLISTVADIKSLIVSRDKFHDTLESSSIPKTSKELSDETLHQRQTESRFYDTAQQSGRDSQPDAQPAGILNALAHAIALGVSAPLHVSIRANPRHRQRTLTYVEARADIIAPFDTAAFLFANDAQRLLGLVDVPAAQAFWVELVTGLRDNPEDVPATLYGYVLRDKAPSFDTDSWQRGQECTEGESNGRVDSDSERSNDALENVRSLDCETRLAILLLDTRLRRYLTDAYFPLTESLWGFSTRRISLVLQLAVNRPYEFGNFLSMQLLQVYAAPLNLAQMQHDAVEGDSLRPLVHKLGSSPPFGLTETSASSSATGTADGELAWTATCQKLASTEVWWRVDRWFEDATNSPSRRQRVTQVFEAVKNQTIDIVSSSLESSKMSELREFLVRKLSSVRLRFRSRPEHVTLADHQPSLGAPTSTALELRQLHRRRFVRFAPFWDEEANRTLEPTDLSMARSNAFYSAIDNSLTVFPGLLGGALYSDEGPISDLLPTLGAVIGHELAHAIDSRGVWYNEVGEAGEWTPREQLGLYISTMQCIVLHFADLGMNGPKVMDESFADSLGLQAAYLVANPRTTAAQRDFFVQYTQIWCGQFDTDLGWEDRDDVHAPPRHRAEFALQFATPTVDQAFGCATDSVKRQAETCRALTIIGDSK